MRSKRRENREKRKKNKSFVPIVKILIPIFLLVIALAFIWLNTKFWNGKDKFIFVTRGLDAGAALTILDPRLDEEIILTIPGDTEVEIARNLGTLRLKNVWQLGINEKLDGALVAETITKNFLFPVFLWRDAVTKKTNIPLGDALMTKIFLLGIKPMNKTEIDLGKSQFLAKRTLSDGETGFRLVGPISGSLSAYFSDNALANKNLRVEITDATGMPGVSSKVGEIIEILGGKVVAIDKKPQDANLECLVIAKDRTIARKIETLFSCKDGGKNSDFDIEVKIGAKFAKRF